MSSLALHKVLSWIERIGDAEVLQAVASLPELEQLGQLVTKSELKAELRTELRAERTYLDTRIAQLEAQPVAPDDPEHLPDHWREHCRARSADGALSLLGLIHLLARPAQGRGECRLPDLPGLIALAQSISGPIRGEVFL